MAGEKLTPAQLESGSFTTLEKGKLTTSGSGESYEVNGTVVDGVLMPPAS